MINYNVEKFITSEFILNVLGLVPNEKFSPIHLQIIMFMIAQEVKITDLEFKANSFGPRSEDVYSALKELNDLGKVDIWYDKRVNGVPYYQINKNHIPDIDKVFFFMRIRWIKKLVFEKNSMDLKELIYFVIHKWPDMGVNLVFQGWRTLIGDIISHE